MPFVGPDQGMPEKHRERFDEPAVGLTAFVNSVNGDKPREDRMPAVIRIPI